MVDLARKKCRPCEGGVEPLRGRKAAAFARLVPDWRLGGKNILRDFRFRDFREALAFVNAVGAIAEEEGHHPDLLLHGWNRVRIALSTHAIRGLSENDFILAAKIDGLAATKV